MSDKKPAAETAVRTGLVATTAIMAPSNPVMAGLVAAAIEPSALVAGQVQQWIGARFNRRVAQTTGNVLERAKAEGIEPDPEKLAELLENAIPFVARARREEKRRMMEDVLFNGVRLLESGADRVEAIEALSLIEELPDAAALVFSQFVYELKQNDSDEIPVIDSDVNTAIPKCGLSDPVFNNIIEFLYSSYGPSKLKCGKSLIVRFEHQRSQPRYYMKLSSLGKWLATWISNTSSIQLPDAES